MRLPKVPQWDFDDQEPAAAEMEARLLTSDGRRTPSGSALLRSAVPAILPRMSRVELDLLGGMRPLISPSVLPTGAPPALLVAQIRSRAALLRHYLDQMPELDRRQRYGVDALCDVATVLHVQPWLSPTTVDETLGPLRALVGPEEDLGFGPGVEVVLGVLEEVAEMAADDDRVQAVTRAWVRQPERHWLAVADLFRATADVTGRAVSLRLLVRATWVPSPAGRRSPLFRALRLRAAAVILADLLDEEQTLGASEPWLAGLAAGPSPH